MKNIILVTLVFLSATAFSDETVSLNSATGRISTIKDGAFCEKALTVVANPDGKIRDLKFEIKNQEDFEKEAVATLTALQEKLSANPYADKYWAQFQYFANLSESTFDVVRKIAMKFSGTGGEKGIPALEKINTMLYGATSVNTQIQQLESLINGKSLFTRQRIHEKEIRETAESIRKCREAIAACKVELPSVMDELNNEATILNKARVVVAQEISLIEEIKKLLPSYLDEEATKAAEETLNKKLTDLQSGSATLGVLSEETKKLIRTVAKVYGDADSVNEGALQRAVIKAAQQNIDIRKAIELSQTKKRPPGMKIEGEIAYKEARSKYNDLLTQEFLPPSRRLPQILEIAQKIPVFTQQEAMDFMKFVTNYNGEASFKDPAVMEYLLNEAGTTYGFQEDNVGYRTYIFDTVIRKVVPDRSISASTWSNWVSNTVGSVLSSDHNLMYNDFRTKLRSLYDRIGEEVYDKEPVK